MHYTLKDHQGSLTATVSGNTVERLSYDAWGRRRNPDGFGYDNVTHTFDRGYTLHEHYDDFNLWSKIQGHYSWVMDPDFGYLRTYNINNAYNIFYLLKQ